jgi:muramoyltetrapeptide carboxypeptidase
VKTLFPPPLHPGDVIGLVSPASAVEDPPSINRAVRHLESLGYRVDVGPHAACTHGYLAGTDAERVSDIHAMFSDRRVRAIVCLRGGYGSPRLLPLLDYRLIARSPKILVGFSDVSALLLAVWRKTRLVTFHGPMAAVDWSGDADPLTEESFWDLITARHAYRKIPLDEAGMVVHCGGRVSGRLLGGNLSLLASLVGTPFLPDFSGNILFLEEVDEEPYRIDRMLTQLRNASLLDEAAGFLAGQFSKCGPRDPSKPSLNLLQILDEIIVPQGKPFLSNLPFGHVRRKLTLPVGVRVCLDADKRELSLLESPVG